MFFETRDAGWTSRRDRYAASSQAAVGDGKRAATALTNAALTQLHLPALPLGLLGDAPNLRPAAAAKLMQQQDAAIKELAACLSRLQEAAAGLAAAADSLQQLLDAEAAAPLLMERAVFAMLPLQLLGSMVAEIHSMHDAELAVKAAVLAGVEQIAGGRGQGMMRRHTQAALALWKCPMPTCSELNPSVAARLPQATCDKPTNRQRGPAAAAAAAVVAGARGVRLHSVRSSCGAPCRCTSPPGCCPRRSTSGGWRPTWAASKPT